MLQDPAFANALHARWFALRRTFINQNALNQIIDSVTSLVSEAQIRHFEKFKVLGSNNGAPEIDAIPTTFAGEVQKLKNWIATRIDWLDANMLGEMPSGLSREPKAVIRIFPTAVQSIMYVESDVNVHSIQIFGLLGTTVVMESKGMQNNAINLSALNPGIYTVLIKLENGQTYTQKILKK